MLITIIAIVIAGVLAWRVKRRLAAEAKAFESTNELMRKVLR